MAFPDLAPVGEEDEFLDRSLIGRFRKPGCSRRGLDLGEELVDLGLDRLIGYLARFDASYMVGIGEGKGDTSGREQLDCLAADTNGVGKRLPVDALIALRLEGALAELLDQALEDLAGGLQRGGE